MLGGGGGPLNTNRLFLGGSRGFGDHMDLPDKGVRRVDIFGRWSRFLSSEVGELVTALSMFKRWGPE